MKAITLHQPFASLVALGVKRIETRSWPTKHRGLIAIHAAAKKPRYEAFREGGRPMPPWFDLVAMSCCYEWWEDESGWWDFGGYQWVGPLGAVVATANLVDCLPMVAEPTDAAHALVKPDELWLAEPVEYQHPTPGCDEPVQSAYRIDEERPYGDFAPGRWAWLLDDIVPLDEAIPATGRQGLWNWDAPTPKEES